MKSLILNTATRWMVGVMVLFSLFIFFRGHDEPGGGFIGGLMGAGAFTLYAVAFGTDAARKVLRIDPVTLIGIGLLCLVVSGFIPLITGDPFLTGKWLFLDWGGSEIKLSSPLVFDIGVYLCVVGFIVAVIFALEEEKTDPRSPGTEGSGTGQSRDGHQAHGRSDFSALAGGNSKAGKSAGEFIQSAGIHQKQIREDK